MNKIEESYAYKIEKFGQFNPRIPFDMSNMVPHKGKIYDSYMRFLQDNGVGMWKNGYFQICQPGEYDSIVDMIFGEDPDFNTEEIFTIGLSGFGNMELWSKKYESISVNVNHHTVICRKFFNSEEIVPAELSLAISLGSIDSPALDAYDEKGNGLFKRALKKYGPLPYGHIYAPKLHPALGGPRTLENYRPAPALEALAIAAQATRFVLRDFSSMPVRDVRLIGRHG